MDIKKVAIVGAGIMGHGIAQVVSAAGIEVALNDIKEEVLKDARAKIDSSLSRMVKKDKISEEEKAGILSRITFTTDLSEALKGSGLVIEAIPEFIDIKKEIFKKFDALSDPEAILATNTSANSISEIASAVKDSSRVIGMHWFNPPVMMKLIEVVKGLNTRDEIVEQIKNFAAKIGKEIVVCRDSQGFICVRLLMALRLECYRMFEEGLASKEDIDKTLRLALGHPMGQFELADFSGLDIEVPICEGLRKVYGERFRPPQILSQLVNSGRLGRKSGKGWYNYNA